MKKTILITGASSGIGKETAKLFNANGWHVVATMRNTKNETELMQLQDVLVIYVAYKTYTFVKLSDGLENKIEKGAVILDVRTAAEYRTSHIQGSLNIPLGEIRERYTELDPVETYITTCSHGLRSVKVENLLKERGFKKYTTAVRGAIWKK